ncbi:prohibitin family protein [Gemmatimonas sp.]|uniref:prohibitin family protein n=1 Tax=Gemmatimonas sp. TaxID=1962908 RepID=UPI00391B7882
MTIPHDAYETDEEIPAPRRSWLPRFSVYAGVWLLVLLFVVVLFYDRSLHSVRSGELGIRWSRFGGTRLGVVYREGLRIIPPWDQLFIYNVRQQEMSDSITVLAKNGLPLRIRYSARFMPAPGYLAKLHQQFGPDYREVLLRPEVVAGIRRVMGNHTPEEIYSRDEEWLNEEVMASIRQEIAQYPVKLEKVLLKELRLTADLEDAINDKLVSEQHALSYEFRLRSEEDEARRKAIEARGVRSFEELSGISILRWRGLQATEALATSPNAKVIVIGSGRDNLPLLLNGAN